MSVVAGRIPVEVNTTSAVFHFLSLEQQKTASTEAEKNKIKGVVANRTFSEIVLGHDIVVLKLSVSWYFQ